MHSQSINLNKIEAFNRILPSTPQLSSYQANWENGFLAYFQNHPGCESPQICFKQHALEIIDSGFTSFHERRLGGQSFSHILRGKEACFCPANTTHWTRWEQPLSFTVVTFEPALFNQILEQIYVCARPDFLPQWQIFDPTIQGIVNTLKADLVAGSPAGKIYGESFLTSLAVHLVKNLSVLPLKLPQRIVSSYAKQKEVLDFIEAYLDTDISLEDLAKIARVSKFYFCRLFKENMNVSPHQYIIRRRVERAKELLKNSELTTVEIALSCGFTHQSHLSRHFKRLVGVSPRKFRLS